jgi:hypothetical protein
LSDEKVEGSNLPNGIEIKMTKKKLKALLLGSALINGHYKMIVMSKVNKVKG